MTNLIIWWAGILVEVTILFRGLATGSISRYPFFYLYIASVAICDACLYVLFVRSAPTYPFWSAKAEILNLVLGYGIFLEIFRHVFSRYPGAERLARIGGLLIFAFVLCFALVHTWLKSETPGPVFEKVIIERDFLTVQAVFFLGILGVVSYYALAVGKNVRGMTVGYGMWLGISMIALSLRSYIGSSFNAVWIFVQPFCYLLSLVAWLISLWNYSPIPVPQTGIGLDADYGSFVSATRSLMGQMRSNLGRAARP